LRKAYSFSKCGNHRLENQDCVKVATNFFALADGMGGHPQGRQAAELACHLALEAVTSKYGPDIPHRNEIVDVFRDINHEIRKQLPGAGTTLTLLMLSRSTYCAASIGDSRVYRIDKSAIHQLSMDQNLFSTTGISDQRNILTNYIGRYIIDPPTISIAALLPSTRFFLSSDGLYSAVNLSEFFKEGAASEESTVMANLEILATKNDPNDNYSGIFVGRDKND
jgi:serine/threonine protein phosphatase PrpC